MSNRNSGAPLGKTRPARQNPIPGNATPRKPGNFSRRQPPPRTLYDLRNQLYPAWERAWPYVLMALGASLAASMFDPPKESRGLSHRSFSRRNGASKYQRDKYEGQPGSLPKIQIP